MKRIRSCFSILVLLVFPTLSFAGVARFFDQPDTGFASNVAVDIIRHNGGVWLATGRGANYTTDDGGTWYLYDSSNGLPGSDVSALFSMNGRIWLATSHMGTLGGSPASYSDGLTYSDNNGLLWHHVVFDSLIPPVEFVSGVYHTVYDITGWHDTHRNKDWLFMTCFAGGFLASQDNGTHWRRIFTSPADSLNFVRMYDSTGPLDTNLTFANRAFSCVVDTSHGDSLFVWEGTVSGVFQHVFVPRQLKFGARKINAISFCDECAQAGNSYVFYAGSAGLVRGKTTGGPYITIDTSSGISAVFPFGGKIFFGRYDTTFGDSKGLGVSPDEGESFNPYSLPAVEGANRRILDFASVGGRLYMAASEAGLFQSPDSGLTWNHIWVDSADTSGSDQRNNVYALFALGDTLRIGTDSGMVTWFMNPAGGIDSSRNFVFPDSGSNYSRVVKIRRQQYGQADTAQANDTTALWVITRSPQTNIVPSLVYRSTDGGLNWLPSEVEISTNDIGFVGDTTLLVSDYGVHRLSDSSGVHPVVIKDLVDSSLVMSDSTILRPHDFVRSIAVRGDTIIMAGDSTVATSRNRLKSFRVFKPNLDSLKADLIIDYTYVNTLNHHGTSDLTIGLSGDFIPAIGVQYSTHPDSTARIFASGRPALAGYGVDGVSYGRVVLVIDTTTDTLGNILSIDTVGHRYRWDQISEMKTFAWNFDNVGDTVLLPSDNGLFLATGLGTADSAVTQFVFHDSLDREVISPKAAVYTARVIDSNIWIGSDEGTIRVKRANLGDQRLTRVTDPGAQVYAYPTPFAPQRGEVVDFHFENSQDGYVTIEIYDFALNLVARPIDHVFYTAGVHPGTNEVGLKKWDGRNGRGDIAAVGVYYIKVTSANGDVKWGKLAVIP